MESVTCFHPYLDEVGFCPECKVTLMNGVETKEASSGMSCASCDFELKPGTMVPVDGFGPHGEMLGAKCPECGGGLLFPMGITSSIKPKAKGFVEWVDKEGWRDITKEAGFWVTWKYKDGSFFVMQCWPELLALVEAAEKSWDARTPAQMRTLLEELMNRTMDLDEKAKEVMDG